MYDVFFPFGRGMGALFPLAVYLFTAYCLYRIAERYKMEYSWFAFIPILNFVLMLQIVKKPVWWIILLIIPIVNIVIAIMVTYYFVKKLGKSGWWVILLMIPFVNIIAWGMLAFEEK